MLVMSHVPTLTIRSATHEDLPTLDRLATLDSHRPLTGPILVAERDGVVVAARSVSTGETIADPFVPTADVIALLNLRAVRSTSPRRMGMPRFGISALRRATA